MVQILVKVVLKASTDDVVGWEQDSLKIRLKALPEKGKANASLIKLLSKKLKVASSRIHIVKGKTSRSKVIQIEGETLLSIQKKLGK